MNESLDITVRAVGPFWTIGLVKHGTIRAVRIYPNVPAERAYSQVLAWQAQGHFVGDRWRLGYEELREEVADGIRVAA